MALPADGEQQYVYRGHEDDRPLLWRPHLNELVGVLGEVSVYHFTSCKQYANSHLRTDEFTRMLVAARNQCESLAY